MIQITLLVTGAILGIITIVVPAQSHLLLPVTLIISQATIVVLLMIWLELDVSD